MKRKGADFTMVSKPVRVLLFLLVGLPLLFSMWVVWSDSSGWFFRAYSTMLLIPALLGYYIFLMLSIAIIRLAHDRKDRLGNYSAFFAVGCFLYALVESFLLALVGYRFGGGLIFTSAYFSFFVLSVGLLFWAKYGGLLEPG